MERKIQVDQWYYSRRADLWRQKNAVLDEIARVISREVEVLIGTPGVKWGLRYAPSVTARRLMSTDQSLVVQVIEQLVRRQLLRLAPINTPNRHMICASLQTYLERRTAFEILRVDIKKFFDNVDHGILKKQIRRLAGIDGVTTLFVDSFLDEVEKITGHSKGLPQGVALSSLLANLYLIPLDRAIHMQRECVFYARFVDDIVIIAERPGEAAVVRKVLDSSLRVLELELNTSGDKFAEIKASKIQFESGKTLVFLGYEFSKNNSQLSVDISPKKLARIKSRIYAAYKGFEYANPTRQSPKYGSEGLLVKRIQLLTSNYFIHKSGRRVLVGLPASSPLVPANSPGLTELDKLLKKLQRKNSNRISAKTMGRLKDLTFEEGMRKRKFIRVTVRELHRCYEVWRGE